MITLQKYGRNAEGCVPYEKIDGAEPKLPHLSFRASALKWRGNPFSCDAKHRAADGGRSYGLPRLLRRLAMTRKDDRLCREIATGVNALAMTQKDGAFRFIVDTP